MSRVVQDGEGAPMERPESGPRRTVPRRAESVYARFLEQADARAGASFEDFVRRHPEREAELRHVHAGMARVQDALRSAAARARLPRRGEGRGPSP